MLDTDLDRLMRVKFDNADHKDDQDEILSALADPTRRAILSRLTRHRQTVDLAGLVADLTTTHTNGTTDQHLQMQIQLYHHHLPKLAEAGLVEFDQQRKEIAATSVGEDVLEVVLA